jgi:uncharacterized protein YegL
MITDGTVWDDNLSGELSESSKSEGGLRIQLFYIVCDESLSMAGASIQAVNDGIVELFDEINSDPILDTKVWVGIIAFEGNARILLPLTQISGVTQIPLCAVGSSSANYGNLFRLLRFVIPRDVRMLSGRFRFESRPLVFFISDGRPSDENWREEWNKLTDPSFKFSPNIVSFGVAGAEKTVIAEVAHWGSKTGQKFFFMAEADGSPGAAIKEIAKFSVPDVYFSDPGPQPFLIVDGVKAGGQAIDGATTFIIDHL